MDVRDEGRKVRTTPGQSFALGILIFVTIAGIGFGTYATVRTIRDPFATKGDGSTVAAQAERESAARLKQQDTDTDGLSDYDETNTYHTSAFLKDSDSDGIDDKTELLAGTNPNCAEGGNCLAASAPPATVPATGAIPGTVPSTDLEQARAQLENMTPSQVRDLLRKQGATDEKLKSLSDEQVMEIYKKSVEQVIEKQKAATQPLTPSILPASMNTATTSSPVITNPAQMPIEQIRQMVLQSGSLQKSDLDKIDDTTLRKMFIDAIGKAEAEQAQRGNP